MILICPGCGHHVTVATLPRRAKLKCSKCGALGSRTVRKPKWWWKPPEPRDPALARAQTYNSLLYYSRGKKYKEGWAAWRFKALYGDWPSDDDRREVEIEKPMPSELLSWIIRQDAKRSAERRGMTK